jgi:hypothetical protein
MFYDSFEIIKIAIGSSLIRRLFYLYIFVSDLKFGPLMEQLIKWSKST